jgi:hypothetical protein
MHICTFFVFSKMKSHKEVTESRFFLVFLRDDRRIRIQEAHNIRIRVLNTGSRGAKLILKKMLLNRCVTQNFPSARRNPFSIRFIQCMVAAYKGPQLMPMFTVQACQLPMLQACRPSWQPTMGPACLLASCPLRHSSSTS